MIVRIVLWNLADSMTNVAELRRYIADEAVPAFDDGGERWGAVYVWESAEAADQTLPSRARELIGREPDIAETFDLEATVSVSSQLDRLGLAFGG